MGAKTLTCLACAQLNRVAEDKPARSAKCGTCGAGLLPGRPVDVDPAILQKAIRHDGLPLVADFWAPWCGPCRAMAPEFAKAARALAGQARLVKVNTQDHRSAAARYRVQGLPALVAFERGKEKKRQSGALRQGQILAWLRG